MSYFRRFITLPICVSPFERHVTLKIQSKQRVKKICYSVAMFILMTYIHNIWVDDGQLMVGQEWVTKAIISVAIIEYWFAFFLGLVWLPRAYKANKVFSFSKFCTLCYQILYLNISLLKNWSNRWREEFRWFKFNFLFVELIMMTIT